MTPPSNRELSIEDIRKKRGPIRQTGTYLVEFTPEALAALMDTANWPIHLGLAFRAFDTYEGTVEVWVNQTLPGAEAPSGTYGRALNSERGPEPIHD